MAISVGKRCLDVKVRQNPYRPAKRNSEYVICGRVTNDIAVSQRCKHHGMSWMESGVLAMALHAAEPKENTAQIAQIDAQNHTSL